MAALLCVFFGGGMGLWLKSCFLTKNLVSFWRISHHGVRLVLSFHPKTTNNRKQIYFLLMSLIFFHFKLIPMHVVFAKLVNYTPQWCSCFTVCINYQHEASSIFFTHKTIFSVLHKIGAVFSTVRTNWNYECYC